MITEVIEITCTGRMTEESLGLRAAHIPTLIKSIYESLRFIYLSTPLTSGFQIKYFRKIVIHFDPNNFHGMKPSITKSNPSCCAII